MTLEYYILIVGFIAGFYMAWNIGANDVANSMASSVGSKAITIRQAIFIAGILNIVGAAFVGSHVTSTISKGIVNERVLSDPHSAVIGALSAIIAAALWVSFSTWKSLPVSTTHSIVGAMAGFGIMCGGFSFVNWCKLGAIVLSWVVSPIFSMVIAFIIFKTIVKLIISKRDSFKRALKYSPLFVGLTIFVVVLSFLFKTPLGKTLSVNTNEAVLIAGFFALILGYLCKYILKAYLKKKKTKKSEHVFRSIQLGTACYMAFAHGANDVANAVGPLAVIYCIVKEGGVGVNVPVPFFLLLFGGIGIAAGIAMAGSRVIKTVGEKITHLDNSRGFSVEFAAASTVLTASKLGLPVSTTHSAIGAVIGVGLAGGLEAVNFGVIFKIILYWVLTVPISALISMIIFKILITFI